MHQHRIYVHTHTERVELQFLKSNKTNQKHVSIQYSVKTSEMNMSVCVCVCVLVLVWLAYILILLFCIDSSNPNNSFFTQQSKKNYSLEYKGANRPAAYHVLFYLFCACQSFYFFFLFNRSIVFYICTYIHTYMTYHTNICFGTKIVFSVLPAPYIQMCIKPMKNYFFLYLRERARARHLRLYLKFFGTHRISELKIKCVFVCVCCYCISEKKVSKYICKKTERGRNRAPPHLYSWAWAWA